MAKENKENRQTQDLDDKDPKQMDDKELLELLKKKVDSWFSYFKDNIIDGRERKRFAFGDQWEDQVAEEYKNTGKVMLTTNKLNPYIRNLVSEVKRFTPQGKVKQTDDSPQNAELVTALNNKLRKISVKSNSKSAYAKGFRNEMTCGYGALLATLEFKSDKTFKQEAGTETVNFPERVGFDPAATSLTKWDGGHSFDYKILTKLEFKNQFGFMPEGNVNNVSTFSRDDGGSFTLDWITEDKVIVFDFYLKEYFSDTLVKLQNGAELSKKEYNQIVDEIKQRQEEDPDSLDPNLAEEMEIVQTRKVLKHKIMNYKFIADEILEREKWASKYLPHVFIDGDSEFIDGKQLMQPFIKDAIDSQRMLNFTNTEIIQNIKDTNNEDYLATPNNIKGFEKMWKDKKRRKGVLLANPDKKTGLMPAKQSPGQINPQLHPLSVKLEGDIRSCLGIYQSNQGATEGDISGKAEAIRVLQGNKSSSVYLDNLIEAIEQLQRVQLDLTKNTALDTQTMDGLDEEGNETTADINKPLPDGSVLNDISQHEFDVEITVGAPFAMQKIQEYREILSYVAAFPQMQAVIPDIAARKLTTDDGIDIANRAKGTLPLEVQAQDKTNPQAAMQAQKQMQQQGQMKQMMTQLQVQGEQIKILAEKQKGQAAQTTSTANMMNAQTNRMTEAGKAQIEAAKLQTEQQKSMIELQTERMKLAGQLAQ